MVQAFFTIFKGHPRVNSALDPNQEGSLMMQLELSLRNPHLQYEAAFSDDAVMRQTFLHHLFSSFVLGDGAFRAAARRLARAYFEERMSEICHGLGAQPNHVFDRLPALLAAVHAFQVWRLLLQNCCSQRYLFCRPSVIEPEALDLGCTAIDELLQMQPIEHPITKEVLQLAPETRRRASYVMQTFHSKLQRQIQEHGVLSLNSLIEACPSNRFAVSI